MTQLNVAITVNNLGLTYQALNQFRQALQCYQTAYELRKQMYVHIAVSLNNIGMAYQLLDEFQQALPYHQQAVAFYQNIYKSPHPDLAMSFNNLALVYQNLAGYRQALKYYQNAHQVAENCFSADHPTVSKILQNLNFVQQLVTTRERKSRQLFGLLGSSATFTLILAGGQLYSQTKNILFSANKPDLSIVVAGSVYCLSTVSARQAMSPGLQGFTLLTIVISVWGIDQGLYQQLIAADNPQTATAEKINDDQEQILPKPL